MLEFPKPGPTTLQVRRSLGKLPGPSGSSQAYAKICKLRAENRITCLCFSSPTPMPSRCPNSSTECTSLGGLRQPRKQQNGSDSSENGRG